MTMTEVDKQTHAREVAQRLINLELDRKTIVDEMSELKSELEFMIENDNVDSSYDFNQGQVFLNNTISYKIPDGLQSEVESKVRDASKLNPELISQYFNGKLTISRKGLKTLRNSADPDLSKLVVQEEKSKVTIKI